MQPTGYMHRNREDRDILIHFTHTHTCVCRVSSPVECVLLLLKERDVIVIAITSNDACVKMHRANGMTFY